MHRLLRGGLVSAAVAAVLVGGGVSTASAEGVVSQADRPVPGQYIVELRGADAVASAASIAQRYGGQVMDTYRLTFSGFSVKGMTEQQARRLAADPAVKAVHQDGTARAVGEQPNPPSWGLDQVDQKTRSLDRLFKYPNTADDVTAYVIDSGVNRNHSEFEGRASFGYDYVDNDADASDCFWHGTHVAGTIAGKTVGVAKKAKVVAVRTLGCGGSAPDSATVSGMEWVAANGKLPAVVNMSLGMDVVGVGDTQVKALVSKGFVVAVAGGNNGTDACQTSPARVPEAITVGWMNDNGSRSGNYGTCLDLFAPGGNIYSADHTGGFRTGSGTSMATPHVAGAAALHLTANPGATPKQVHDALAANATPNLVTNPGSGSPNKLLYTGYIGGGDPPACGSRANDQDYAIPDTESVTSTVEQSGCGGQAPATLAVRVDIDHTYAGDLAIDLIGPSGAEFALRKAGPGLGGSDGVHETFTVDASGEKADGVWKLRVTDVYRFDTGTLTGWSVTF
ncbi:S8 family peptidase [Actinokineospora sp. UTMC 2448]|uniref:S8 family peptidase n=1 Tax=Actinokineospora sp. UTMC 2448 TaxID=2268449 RepID=UPI002164A627|nr:S8 family peptidase [Actinokineospora sp. UTMC 2448]UVS80479.1 Extracellular serine proteinase precursor [Actinokineospora sp. UTMC 2448]